MGREIGEGPDGGADGGAGGLAGGGTDPHADQPLASTGRPLEEAATAMILVHGRGASARSILGLAREVARDDMAFVAPQAAGHTWYPRSFLEPLERNEPYLGSALRLLGSTVERIEHHGIPSERLIVLGFSQGACLTAEFAARHPRRFGGLAVLTGGLIGPEGTPRDYPGSLDGTPVLLGSSDPDPHIPLDRVNETERVLQEMGADVTKRIYPDMGHTVNQDELGRVRRMVEALPWG